MIEAKILKDSICRLTDCRITTFKLTYNRFILPELAMHRLFSRSSISSRAIPVAKLIQRTRDNPAYPVEFGRNQKGMSAGEAFSGEDEEECRLIWYEAMLDAAKHAERLAAKGVHKQVANRPLEPYAHVTTLVTATEWGNFFHLRADDKAQPEFADLAFKMLEEYLKSVPDEVGLGGWHIPFGDDAIAQSVDVKLRLKIAAARAARNSYENFDGKIEPEKDYVLHDRLVESGEWGPLEHSARALSNSVWRGNFFGWEQYRKTFPCEHMRYPDLRAILARRKNGQENQLQKVGGPAGGSI